MAHYIRLNMCREGQYAFPFLYKLFFKYSPLSKNLKPGQPANWGARGKINAIAPHTNGTCKPGQLKKGAPRCGPDVPRFPEVYCTYKLYFVRSFGYGESIETISEVPSFVGEAVKAPFNDDVCKITG